MKIVRFRGRLILLAALSFVVLFAIFRTYGSLNETKAELDSLARQNEARVVYTRNPEARKAQLDKQDSDHNNFQDLATLAAKNADDIFDRRGFYYAKENLEKVPPNGNVVIDENRIGAQNEKAQADNSVNQNNMLNVGENDRKNRHPFDQNILVDSNSNKNDAQERMVGQNNKNRQPINSNTVAILPHYLLPSDLNKNTNKNEEKQQNYPILTQDKRFIPTRRIVHMDLKGAHPKVHFFKELFQFIVTLGGTGILIEYEDVFPYTGQLAFARSSQAYSEKDITKIIQWARDFGLEVIPLIQTFGHLEWILKHEQFAHYREVDRYAQVICLSNFDAVNLVKEAIDQVMRLHKDTSEFFHMGADEAFQIGMCPRCQNTIANEMGNLRDRLMLRHIANISSHVREKHGKRVLMWHDMLNNVDVTLLKAYKLPELVEPVVWNYAEQIDQFLAMDFWQRFSNTFPYIWASSAFKGADGPSRYYSNVPHYLRNHESWNVQMTRNYKDFKEFRGLILTGWQRYDHFALLAEILPVGMPSLAVNLLTIAFGQFDRDVLQRASRAMQCGDGVEFAYDSKTYVTHGCKFPGAKIYELVQDFSVEQTIMREQLLTDYQLQGWLSPYNTRHNFSSAWYLDQISDKIRQYLTQMDYTAGQLKAELAKVFRNSTVQEFMMEYIDPDVNALRQLMTHAIRLGAMRYFPAREFPIVQDAQPDSNKNKRQIETVGDLIPK